MGTDSANARAARTARAAGTARTAHTALARPHLNLWHSHAMGLDSAGA